MVIRLDELVLGLPGLSAAMDRALAAVCRMLGFRLDDSSTDQTRFDSNPGIGLVADFTCTGLLWALFFAGRARLLFYFDDDCLFV